MSPGDWESFLGVRLDRRVTVRYGRARTAPVQFVEDRRGVRVRLHRFFQDADEQVREDLAAWLRVGRRARTACDRLDRWIDTRLEELPPRLSRPVTLRPRGDAYDLDGLARGLYAQEFVLDFEDRPRPGVTWGRRRRSRARRSLQLGSYDVGGHVVRIHPVLDQRAVPDWFVRYVLFHEILHAAMPAPTSCGGRTMHHGPDFRRRERTYGDYRRAVSWQARNIGRLIRSARRAEPLAGEPMRQVARLVQGWLFPR